MLLGSNKTLVEFDEMKVQDFDKVSDGKQKKEERKKIKEIKKTTKITKTKRRKETKSLKGEFYGNKGMVKQ